jgi:hypothetical protein
MEETDLSPEDNPEDQQAAFGPGRTSEFFGGAAGGMGTHAATSMQQNVPAAFQPSSVLALPNMYKYANGESQSTFDKTMPMQSMLRQSTGGYSGVMNV